MHKAPKSEVEIIIPGIKPGCYCEHCSWGLDFYLEDQFTLQYRTEFAADELKEMKYSKK